jgi:sigma-B regulation protein RsbU (phosphoserine phosphatase)
MSNPDLQLAGLGLPLLLLTLLLVGWIATLRKRQHSLTTQRNTLLQEKEAALGFVQNIGSVFADAETVEMNQLLERVLHYAVRTCKAGSGALYLRDADNNLIARALSGVIPPLFHIDDHTLQAGPDTTQQLHTLLTQKKLAPGETLIGEVARVGNAIHIEDAELDKRVPQTNIAFLRIRTLLLVPMRFGNDVIGVMILANRTGNSRFADSDLNLAQALAAQASVPIHYAGLQETLEQKRQLDRDMQIARQIQHSLLPQSLPWFPSVELSGFNHPALDIGGDYYDVIEIDPKHIGLVIADVSGKGIGGALMMAVCRSVLQANAQNEYDPASMLTSLNKTLSLNLADDMFISMLYMVLNTDTRLLSYARAGHEAPLILHHGSDQIDRTETPGIAIGLVDDPTFSTITETRNVQLRPGDLIVTYTDGITEAMNNDNEEWGLDQLIHSIKQHRHDNASDLLDHIEADVLSFVGNTPQHDDMTMLAVHIK